jgi:hypothetical protein
MSKMMDPADRAMIAAILHNAMETNGGVMDGRATDYINAVMIKGEFEVYQKGDGEKVVLRVEGESGGMPAAEWVAKHLRNLRPNLFPTPISLPENEALIDSAFGISSGKPNISKVGELYRGVGEYSFNELAKRHSYDLKNPSKPGRAEGAEPGAAKPKASKSPWSESGWSFSEQTRLVKTLGVEKAAQMAASAGSFLGASKPGARRLTQAGGF